MARGTALEMAVLGLLHDAPMHGYELRKQVTGLLGWGRVLSYGTLYPCLKTLVRSGYLAATTAPPATAATTDRAAGTAAEKAAAGSRRRTRITYSLTAAGRERFAALVTDVGPGAWDDDNFGVHFAFFASTDTRSRVRILEGRRSRLEERLERVRSSPARTRGGRADPYTLELRRHGIESVAREVRWLGELIDAERARLPGSRAPGRPDPAPQPAASTSDSSAPTGMAGTPPPPPQGEIR